MFVVFTSFGDCLLYLANNMYDVSSMSTHPRVSLQSMAG